MKSIFLGYREFASESEIKELVTQTAEFDESLEQPDEIETLPIFDTSTQRTWILTTRARLYCVLDDIRKAAPALQWTLDSESLVHQGDLAVEIGTREKSPRTGLLDIGQRRGWLYSKGLFPKATVEAQLESMILNKMSD